MGYIGRDNRVVSFTKQSFTANGVLTSFTLDYGVGDSSGILVSVGGVVQQPGVAYTASGTTLTFTAAPGLGTPVWVVYLGKELFSEKATVYSDSDSQIGTGNGTTTPLTLSHSVTNPQSIIVTLNGVAQVPTTDYAVSGTTLTFVVAPDSSKEIIVYFLELESSSTYIPNGSITAAKLAASGTLPAWNGSALTNLDAVNLTGALPAIDGSALTNQPGPIVKSASDPIPTANLALGTMHLNHTTGQMWVLTDATTNLNTWTNVGTGTGDIANNPPTNPNNTGSFQNIIKNTNYQFTFSGATDPDAGDSVTHYHVDQISDGAVLSVSAASVAAGSAHTFTAGNVGVDTNITFRVRAKDSFNAYSSGVTVTVTILSSAYTAATGGNTIGTSGDYKYHIFTTGGTFQVTQAPVATGNVEYLIVGGGGGGGGGNNGGGGGGGGDYVTGSITPTATSYNVSIGGGGADQPNHTTKGFDGNSTSVFGITAIGGGAGGGAKNVPSVAQGSDGGSGGGGGCNDVDGWAGNDIGAGQGNNGGTNQWWTRAGGGGGAGSAGGGSGSVPHGGNGVSNSIGGSSPHGHGHSYFAAGGGGGEYTSTPGDGGTSGGGQGGGARVPTAGAANTGSGGGGGGYPNMGGFGGGNGIVIVKYKYQN